MRYIPNANRVSDADRAAIRDRVRRTITTHAINMPRPSRVAHDRRVPYTPPRVTANTVNVRTSRVMGMIA